MALVIQKRDIQILKYVFGCRAVAYAQVKRRYFATSSNSAANRRLSSLAREGYLKAKSAVHDTKMLKYVEVMEKSWPLIQNEWPFKMDTPHFKSESPVHDMRMAEILFRFNQLKSFHTFLSENILQSSLFFAEDPILRHLASFQSDAALFINGKDGRVQVYGIELEISKKTSDRYKEKVSSYYLASGIDGVIYICGDQQILNSIARVDKEICTNRKSFLYSELESEVLKRSDKIIFKSHAGKTIEFS